MSKNMIDRNYSGPIILEEVVPIYRTLLQRLQKMRLRKSMRMSLSPEKDMQHVWPIFKNEERLTRQRAIEKSGLNYWLKDEATVQQVIANYEEAVEKRKREEIERFREIDDHREKIPLLALMQNVI